MGVLARSQHSIIKIACQITSNLHKQDSLLVHWCNLHRQENFSIHISSPLASCLVNVLPESALPRQLVDAAQTLSFLNFVFIFVANCQGCYAIIQDVSFCLMKVGRSCPQFPHQRYDQAPQVCQTTCFITVSNNSYNHRLIVFFSEQTF